MRYVLIMTSVNASILKTMLQEKATMNALKRVNTLITNLEDSYVRIKLCKRGEHARIISNPSPRGKEVSSCKKDHFKQIDITSAFGRMVFGKWLTVEVKTVANAQGTTAQVTRILRP